MKSKLYEMWQLNESYDEGNETVWVWRNSEW